MACGRIITTYSPKPLNKKRSLLFFLIYNKKFLTFPFISPCDFRGGRFLFTRSYLGVWRFSLFILVHITQLPLLFGFLNIYLQLINLLKISLSLSSFPPHCFPLKLLSLSLNCPLVAKCKVMCSFSI